MLLMQGTPKKAITTSVAKSSVLENIRLLLQTFFFWVAWLDKSWDLTAKFLYFFDSYVKERVEFQVDGKQKSRC